MNQPVEYIQYPCFLSNRQISVTGNTPYGTGIGIHTSTVP
jgi:hypothetical protein